jgi:hypothetical protein
MAVWFRYEQMLAQRLLHASGEIIGCSYPAHVSLHFGHQAALEQLERRDISFRQAASEKEILHVHRP